MDYLNYSAYPNNNPQYPPPPYNPNQGYMPPQNNLNFQPPNYIAPPPPMGIN